MITLLRAGRLSLFFAAAFAAPAMAQSQVFVAFTGFATGGGTVSGTAELTEEGALVSLLGFNATFNNLLADGAAESSATFTLADAQDAYFNPSDPQDGGLPSFSFDLSGIENGVSAVSVGDDAVYAFDQSGWGDYFNLQVTEFNVPEPASIAIMGAGLLGLAALRRRVAQ